MKNRPLNIPHPSLTKAQILSPLELNGFKLEDRHTLLTPELLKKMSVSTTHDVNHANK